MNRVKRRKPKTTKLSAAVTLLAKLYHLNKRRLLNGDVVQHTLYNSLERVGYRWDGTAWRLPERPWMFLYRASSADADTSPAPTEAETVPESTEEPVTEAAPETAEEPAAD